MAIEFPQANLTKATALVKLEFNHCRHNNWYNSLLVESWTSQKDRIAAHSFQDHTSYPSTKSPARTKTTEHPLPTPHWSVNPRNEIPRNSTQKKKKKKKKEADMQK